MTMKATIIGTLGTTNKRQVEGFNILEIDGDLLKLQEKQPLDVTGNCRGRRSNFSFDVPELIVLEVEDADADATTEDTAPKLWAFRGYLVKVSGIFRTNEERALLVKNAVLKREKRLDKLRKQGAL